MAPGLDNQSINSWQPILSSLPFEIFLILGTHLGTRSLSRLSRTCRTLRILLAFQLKRHHIFRLVGSYLLRTCRPYRRSIPRLGSIFRLSRTCRTLQNALAPFAHELHLGYAPMYIHKCTNLNDHLGVVRCLTSIGTPYPDLSYCAEVPLRFAVLKRREKIVEVLLDHGLSPHGRNCDLRTPLMVAIENQDEGIVKMLLEKGARVGNVWRVQHHHWVGYSMRRLLEEYGIEMKWEVRRGTKSLWV